MENTTSISIVTPNFNGGETLLETIDSVVAQGYPNLEYFVFDGGSDDDSESLIRSRESTITKWVCRKDEGQYFAISDALNQSSGEVMGWLNSDDCYFPWTFKIVDEIFNKFPEVEWITGIPIVTYQGIPKAIKPARIFPQKLIAAGVCNQTDLRFIQQESTFWRRSLWNRAGGLDTTYHLAADFDLWTRFAQTAPLYTVNALLGSFHDRGQENRSRKHVDKYMQEVSMIQSSKGVKAELYRNRFKKRKIRFHRIQNIPFLRGRFSRAFYREYRAPFINWNLRSNSYEIEQRALFS